MTEGNRLALYFLQNERISEAFCDSHNYSFGCCKNVHSFKEALNDNSQSWKL